MTPLVPTSASLPTADPAFDALVDGLISRLQTGEVVDWSIVAREHPEHARRLRTMAVALEALGDLDSIGDPTLPGMASGNGKEELVPGVLGDFHILREVGRGGMAVVYEAEQVSLNRRVALKVLPFAATMDPRQLDRFRHEARAAAQLHHRHIVPVYGVGCERGVHYYAMQLIEGCSLATVIEELRGTSGQGKKFTGETPGRDVAGGGEAETRRVTAQATIPSQPIDKSFRRIAELIIQAVDALEYAHSMGVVHRDVKPANLLLDAGGSVWVTDFGLARLGEGPGLTLSGELLGTLRYMSPEQALAPHGLVDHRTDVYALGATLYELLTLQPAVDGASKQEILHRLAFDVPVPPRKLDKSIPGELETVTLKALAKDPQERYGTAQEFADDLRRWLEDRPIQARPPSPVQRLKKWSRRHRPLVALVAVFLTLLVVGLCLGAVGYGLSKGELAEDRNRFAQEKEQSEHRLAKELRHVLIERADAVRLARQPGYRLRVWTDLRNAIALPATGEDEEKVRTTVLACLSDCIGLDAVTDPTIARRRTIPDLPAKTKEWVRMTASGHPIATSPDAQLIALTRSDGQIVIYNQKRELIRQEDAILGGVYDLAMTDDGRTLVAGCEQGFVVWHGASADRWVVRSGNIFSVALSPNGRLLATAGRQLELWSLAGNRLIASWPAPAAGARVEFSADGRVLLAVANGVPMAGWPVSDTPERLLFDGHTQGVPALAFSPDGRQLVSVSKDRTVRVWDAVTGSTVRMLAGHQGEIEAMAFNPDGSLLATGDLLGSIRVWDAQSGNLLAEVGRGKPPGQIWRLQFGPGGEYLAAGGGHLVAWTVRTSRSGVSLERLSTLTVTPSSLGVIDLAPRPGSSELVYLIRGGRLNSFDLAKADEPRLLTNARVALRSLHFTPAGDRLTFVSSGGALGLWNWNAEVASDTHRRAETVAMSADGRWVAVGGPEKSITVVELSSGREVFTLPPEEADVWCLAWSPDGLKVAAGLSDGGVAVWDLEQVRARLTEFGIETPSTASAKNTPAAAPVPAFDQVVRVNGMRAEAEKNRRLAAEARNAGDHAAVRDHLKAALSLDERLAEILPDAPGHRKRQAGTYGALARAQAQLGDTSEALRDLEAEARLLEQLLTEDPGNPAYRRLVASQRTDRSRVFDQAGRFEEALDNARQALADREELAAPGDTVDHEQLVVAYHNLGLQLSRAGRLAEAERWYRTALTAQDRLAADIPSQADTEAFRTGRGTTLTNLGILRARASDVPAAEKLFREAAAVRTRLADDFPANPEYASELGRTLEWLGGMLRDQKLFDESVGFFREAVRRQRSALKMRPKNPEFRDLCCKHQAQLADTFLQMSRSIDAADAARDLSRLAPDDPAVLLRAACLFANCSALTQKNPGLPWGFGWTLMRSYQREAVALVRQAIAKGLADQSRVLSYPVFDPVRGCEEFHHLLREVTVPKK